jgi:hypothetical protein
LIATDAACVWQQLDDLDKGTAPDQPPQPPRNSAGGNTAPLGRRSTTDVDIEDELAQLGLTGYRPLRVRGTLF